MCLKTPRQRGESGACGQRARQRLVEPERLLGQEGAPLTPHLSECPVSSRGCGHVFSAKLSCLGKHALVHDLTGHSLFTRLSPSVLVPLTSGKACDAE